MGIFRRTDSPYWWYRVQLKGKVKTGSTDTSDKRLAMRIYLEKHHQFTEEYHLPSHKGQGTNFFWMCAQFLEKHSKVNKRSWIDDEVIIKKLKGHFGDVPLANIQAEQIEGYKASRKDFVKEATINRELAVLKTIFTKAVLWGYAYKNPVKEVRLFKEERIPIRILTAEERRKLLETSPDNLKPAILMALKTGMRQSEIFNLRWKEVDLAHETISVTHTKSKKLREIPIHPELKAFFELMPQTSPYVLCDKAGQKMVFDGAIRKAFERLKKDLGMPELTFHALRHNFASELISKGADIRTVQEYMGHSSLRMLQRYAHVNKGIWRSTIQLLGNDSLQNSTTLTLRSNFTHSSFSEN
ncbi:MAG: site-specific integrase [Elusimicrobia bacterium]|nr:site-specific integrase [Elusimicrobiota bacterium]MDE2424484.1 site-specific integrase [Elusimicrobiota bacterium]